MCEDSRVERMYWMRKVERLRQEMEREARERRGETPAAAPAEPRGTARDPEPLPV